MFLKDTKSLTATLEAIVLGCGSSAGVPRADGEWGACDPAEPRNHRSRCSLLVRRLSPADAEHQTTVIVDAAPEFRPQCVAAGVKRLDGLLVTHDHADQCHGLDDIRAFALRQRRRIDVWMDADCGASLNQRFRYIFEGEGLYPPIATARPLPPHGVAFQIDGPSGPITAQTFPQDHGGPKCLGYRFGNLAYSSDVVDFEDATLDSLIGLDVWIVDALRYAPHPTHAHLDKTLGWIDRIRPRRAILTNMHFDLDYRELSKRLPVGVEAGYDGLRLEVLMDAVST